VARAKPDLGLGPARIEGARGTSTADPARLLVHLGTRCRSIDEFVQRFSGFASEGGLVLPAAGEVRVDTVGRFLIRLADRSVAMRGTCRVAEVRAAPSSVPGKPRRTLMRVQLLEMDEGSRNVHSQLLACRRAPAPAPAPPIGSGPTVVARARPLAPANGSGPPAPPPQAVSTAFAPTLIGSPPGKGPPPSFGARARAATASLPATPAPLSVETRAPGALYTLPANPLSDLAADDLDSFIEGTLSEVESDGIEASPVMPSPDAPLLRVAEAAPPVRADPEPEVLEVVDPVAATRLGRLTARVPPEARKMIAGASPYAICTILGIIVGHLALTPAHPPAHPPARAVPRTAVAPVPAPPAPSPPPVARAIEPPASARPIVLEPKPVAPPDKPAAPEQPAEAVAVAAPPPADIGTPGMSSCAARIATQPDDAEVFWGGKSLGHSPLDDVPVPCGPATVTLRHERYRPVTRTITAQPGVQAKISERLRRPPGSLVISSSPPHARVSVNLDLLGAAPQRMSTLRYEHVEIQVSLAGYLPWMKSVYLKEPLTRIHAQLTPLSRAAGGKRPALAR
jgi:hypothetical protein